MRVKTSKGSKDWIKNEWVNKTLEPERIKGRILFYIILYGLIRVRSWRGATVSLMNRLRTIWELWLRCISKYLSNKELMLPILFRFLSSKWKISFFLLSFFFNHHFVVLLGVFSKVLSIHLLFHLMLVYWIWPVSLFYGVPQLLFFYRLKWHSSRSNIHLSIKTT